MHTHHTAIAWTNIALSSFTNLLGSTTDGILSTSAHQQSSTIRHILHVNIHPERDPDRTEACTLLDYALFLADAIACGTTTKFGSSHIPHIPHTLILEDIITKLIPLNSWHLCKHPQHKHPRFSSPMAVSTWARASQIFMREAETLAQKARREPKPQWSLLRLYTYCLLSVTNRYGKLLADPLKCTTG